MTTLRALLTIVHLTLHEAARRRVLLAALIVGLAFLILYAIGFHFIESDVHRQGGAPAIERKMVLTFITLAGLYAANFLMVMTAVLLPVDTLSGEIASGVMQTLASKPIGRSTIVLGKWLAYAVTVAAYLLLLAGGVFAIARLVGGLTVAHTGLALALMLLEVLVLVSVSIAGGTRLGTVTNGILAFGLYGLAFVGGWVEQVGTFTQNDTARRVGIVASLLMPSESMWRLAAYHMQPPIMIQVQMTPFSSASVPSGAMVIWTVGYAIVAVVIGVLAFRKRPL